MTSRKALEHIRVRREFLAAAKAEKQVRRGFVLQARRRGDEQPARLGLTATKKIGNAVIRNRTRRRLRALADDLFPKYAHSGYDYVLVGRVHTPHRAWADLQHDLKSALKAIHADPA